MKKFNVWAVIEEIDEKIEETGKDTSIRKLAWFKTTEDAESFIEDIWIEDIKEKHSGKYPYEET